LLNIIDHFINSSPWLASTGTQGCRRGHKSRKQFLQEML